MLIADPAMGLQMFLNVLRCFKYLDIGNDGIEVDVNDKSDK